jgi:tight adherence protein C
MHIDLVVTLVAVFASVALISGTLVSVALSNASPERRRLRQLARPPAAAAPRAETMQLSDVPNPAIERLSKVLPKKSPKTVSRLRRRLAAVGYDSYGAVVLYSAAQLVLPIVFGIAPLLLLGLRSGGVLAAAAAQFGFALPGFILARMTKKYRKAIQDGLPDALDLIIVCVEAGSSLDQAIVKASRELEISLPEIAHELKTLSTETRAGKPRLEAFQDLARRTGVDEVRSLVAMLIQADRFGTSVAQGLRTHADTSRVKRRQRAEERASTVGVKLVFPLVLCLIPALYVVCLGPVVVRIYRALF